MALSEQTQRDILLIIVSMLFITFIISIEPSEKPTPQPIVIP